MTPSIFVSYAVAPGEFSDLRRFLGDVENRVRQTLAVDLPATPPPEFVDGWLRPGRVGSDSVTSWPATGRSATGRPATAWPATGASWSLDCAVLVAMYSEAYFQDDDCRRAWSWFYERTRWFAQRTGRSSPALVGVPWTTAAADLPAQVRGAGPMLSAELDGAPGVPAVPVAAGDRQQPDGALWQPADWTVAPQVRAATVGYDKAVAALARLVVDGLAAAVPPMAAVDARHVGVHPALLSPLGRHGEDQPCPPPSRRARARRQVAGVGVVVAAAPRHAQPPSRTKLEFYGDEPGDWTPFRPAYEQTVFELARAALSANAIEDSVCYPATEQLADDFTQARSEGRVVVVLVDPWLADTASYRDQLVNIFRQASDGTLVAGTLVVFNSTDEETTRSTDELRVKLRSCFTADRGGRVARFDEVHDAEGLVADLVPAVVRARNAKVGRPVAADAASSPARLAGPRGETWVDLQIWSGTPLLPRYGDSSPER